MARRLGSAAGQGKAGSHRAQAASARSHCRRGAGVTLCGAAQGEVMKSIVIVMLALQVALLVVTAFTILKAKPSPGRPRPIWSSLAIALIISASTSFQIASDHRGADGSELLEYGSGLLMGMGLLSLMVLIRQRLGTDAKA
jgi:hypothetical protein